MSEAQDPTSGEPAAAAHDPRLDASGEEHPGVQPSKFDLIALEQTRYGLQFLGVGLALWAVAHPFIDHPVLERGVFIGWCAYALGLATMALGVWICAPTPHGPMPRFAKGLFLAGTASGVANALVHFLWLFTGDLPDEWIRLVTQVGDNFSRLMCLCLLWILWRFCQNRGLTGRAIVWLWLAMAITALELPVAIWGWQLAIFWHSDQSWTWLERASWAFVPLAVIAFFAARQTARDVWLDAVYRHSKFFLVTNPKADVVPLHSAERH